MDSLFTDLNLDPKYTFLMGALIGAAVILYLFRLIADLTNPYSRHRGSGRRRRRNGRRDDEDDYDDERDDRRVSFLGLLLFLAFGALGIWWVHKEIVGTKEESQLETPNTSPLESNLMVYDGIHDTLPESEEEGKQMNPSKRAIAEDVWGTDKNYRKEPHWSEVNEPMDRIFQLESYKLFGNATAHANRLKKREGFGKYSKIWVRQTEDGALYSVILGPVGQLHAEQMVEAYKLNKKKIRLWKGGYLLDEF